MSTPVYIPHWGNSTQGTVQVLHKWTETDGRFWQGYVSEMEMDGTLRNQMEWTRKEGAT